MMELLNIYITTGGEAGGFLGANGHHSKNTHGAHIWIHNGEVKKQHSYEGIEIDVDRMLSRFEKGFHESVSMVQLDFSDVYEDVQRINVIDPTTPELRFCKISEEFGELVQAVNKKLGRKVIKETEQEVLDLILEESADTVQCVISYMDEIGLTFDKDEESVSSFWFDRDVSYTFSGITNKDSYLVSPERHILVIEKLKGELAVFLLEKKGPGDSFPFDTWENRSKSICLDVFRRVFALAGVYGFTPGHIIDKIAQKNVKWERVVNKRKNEKSKPA